MILVDNVYKKLFNIITIIINNYGRRKFLLYFFEIVGVFRSPSEVIDTFTDNSPPLIILDVVQRDDVNRTYDGIL